MTDQPQAPPNTIPVPMDASNTPQRFVVAKDPSGAVILQILQPLVTHLLVLSTDAAKDLAKQLREAAGGLQIVDAFPPNGRHPT